jgi:hypothetical protein
VRNEAARKAQKGVPALDDLRTFIKLQKGGYRIAAQFTETDHHFNNSGFVWVGWNTWVGTLQSNFVDFIVTE